MNKKFPSLRDFTYQFIIDNLKKNDVVKFRSLLEQKDPKFIWQFIEK